MPGIYGSVTLSLCGFPCLKRNTHPFYFTTLSRVCQSLFKKLVLEITFLYYMHKQHPRISTFCHAKTSKTVLQLRRKYSIIFLLFGYCTVFLRFPARPLQGFERKILHLKKRKVSAPVPGRARGAAGGQR